MSSSRFVLRSYFAIIILALVSPMTVLASTKGALKTQVRFLATSTSIRSGFGENEDVDSLELTGGRAPAASVPFHALVVDRYPVCHGALSLAVLAANPGAEFRVLWDAGCDRSPSEIPLRRYLDDSQAILPEKLGYTITLPMMEDRPSTLPCYRRVRR
jgi:hypothetical protein